MFHSGIEIIDSMSQLNESCVLLLGKPGIHPHDVLLIFDVDMTLIQPCYPATALPVVKQYFDIYRSVMASLPKAFQKMASGLDGGFNTTMPCRVRRSLTYCSNRRKKDFA
jgi:hypothetical protein